jgi:Chlamydia polymorphic membrane protein (Chlamydia_PMP) repeat
VTGSSFTGNTATGDGGAIYDLAIIGEMDDSTFSQNKATDGGALWFDVDGAGILGDDVIGGVNPTDTKIYQNIAGGSGGGLDTDRTGNRRIIQEQVPLSSSSSHLAYAGFS